jgi:hypothetical protein
MGVTDATIRILVLAALRKQLAKPDAADLNACQEYRRAMNTSLMAVCSKMNFPAQCADDYDFDGFLRELKVPEVRAVHIRPVLCMN